ncbi:hypothetical protein MKW92_027913 [Papaver armeniacum]|nr:hypothetical protein MKW92_027913 [Papaver armeniacum]
MVITISCWITLATSSSSFLQAKPGCQQKCGDVIIPYPFGIISASGRRDCSLNDGSGESHGFSIKCDTTYIPPKPFLASASGENRLINIFRGYIGSQLFVDTEILSISESEVRLKTLQTISCYNKSGALVTASTAITIGIDLVRSPFTFSHTKNRVFAVGCDTNAVIIMDDDNDHVKNYTSQCLSECASMENVFDVADSCTGNGC